jgi:hypothetical protein
MGMQAQAGRKAQKSAALSAALSLPAGVGEPLIIFINAPEKSRQ